MRHPTETAIQTYTGALVDFLNPDPGTIHIADIAHGLANVCRFSGQSKFFYSVAEHSVYVAENCVGSKMVALLHDATEAYMSDLPGPLKRLCMTYQHIENRLWKAICQRFQITDAISPEIKRVDMRMLATEKRDVFSNDMHWPGLDEFEPYDHEIAGHKPDDAKQLFLTTFTGLGGHYV